MRNVLFQGQPTDMYVENRYEAEDFGDRHILVRLDPTKSHRVCIVRSGSGFFPTVGFVGSKAELQGVVIERQKDGWYQGSRKIGN